MGIQPLTSPAPEQPLEFSDGASCKHWVEQLTLTNVQLTQQVLTRQLAGLNSVPLAPLERLKILEALKEPVRFVQDESARRYTGKPLPLAANEAAAWNSVIALWREKSRNYQPCLKASREGDLAVAPHAGLIAMRCLRLLERTMLDYYRVYRQPPGALWQALHELYFFAESHGFARIRVQDNHAHPVSP
ncbi:MAG: hypothetical protein HYV99_07825 [Betaproteobacteria bacterium]|nr:hypothetical protein [Betaproteobacteria bacterium]